MYCAAIDGDAPEGAPYVERCFEIALKQARLFAADAPWAEIYTGYSTELAWRAKPLAESAGIPHIEQQRRVGFRSFFNVYAVLPCGYKASRAWSGQYEDEAV